MTVFHHGFEKSTGRQCTIMIAKSFYTKFDTQHYCTISTTSKNDQFSRKKGRSICSIRMHQIQNFPDKKVRGAFMFETEDELKNFLLSNFRFNSTKTAPDFVDSLIEDM